MQRDHGAKKDAQNRQWHLPILRVLLHSAPNSEFNDIGLMPYFVRDGSERR